MRNEDTVGRVRELAVVVRNAVGTALWLAFAALAWLLNLITGLPDRMIQGTLDLSTDFATAVTPAGRGLALLVLAGLLTLPVWAGAPALSTLTVTLWFAYAALAWNIAGGFAGQISLGHALFLGIGAYVGSGVLIHAGQNPWLGPVLAVPVAGAVGGLVGWLASRPGLSVARFALVTAVLAEAGRHAALLAGPHALPAVKGGPALFYYLILAMVLAALVLSRVLQHSGLGCRWLAVREDAVAAAAAGVNVTRARASALAISAALMAPAGAFQACLEGGLFPDSLFSFTRSFEILAIAAIGGLGTLFGPVLGALIVTPIGEMLSTLPARMHHEMPGLRLFCIGALLVLVMVLRPTGLWLWLARRLGLVPSPGGGSRK
ncbi:MAG: branched-chain amino acid ABC transporter permease [Rhodospirillaceae bacterium]